MPTFETTMSMGYKLQLVVNQASQNIEKNQTTFNYEFRILEGTTPGYWQNSPGVSWSIRTPANSTFRSGSRINPAYDFRGNIGSNLIASGSRTVSHNSDGTYSARWEAHWAGQSTSIGGGSVGGTVTASTIPRATTPTFSGNFVAGTAKTISLPRASTSFTHEVRYYFGASEGLISSSAGASVSWTPPMSLLERIPNGTSGLGTLKVVTKSGSTVIGQRDVRYTLEAPSSVVPTVSSVSWTDTNTTVRNNIGALVQGLSKVTGTVTAAGTYGSTITSRRLVVDGGTFSVGQVIDITKSGTITAFGEATDSRGRKATRTANLSVLPYQVPQVNSMDVFRATSGGAASDTGVRLRLTLNASATSLVVGGTQKNSLRIVIKTRPTGGAWTTRNTINHTSLTYNTSLNIGGGGIYGVSQSYDVRVELNDNTGTPISISEFTVPTASVTMDMNGTNLGVGKYWEQGALDVGSGGIYSNGTLVPDITQLTSMWHVNRQANGRTAFGTRQATTPYGAGETAIMLYPVGDSTGGAFAILKDGSASSNVLLRVMDNGDLSIQGRVVSDHQPYAMSVGFVGNAQVEPAGDVEVTVTFPVGRFTVTPRIFATPYAGTNIRDVNVTGVSATTTSATFRKGSNSSVYRNFGFTWQAIQMTATSANG